MKRLLDIVLIIVFFPIWGTVFVLTLVAVLLVHGRPVFFRQRRAGKGGKPFTIIKFRTMSDGEDASGILLPDAQRLTPFGRFLRSLSLDELPELWNVLKGDMSLVGPRPLPLAYVDRYSGKQSRRLECRPGITGWAQVNGRNAVDWDTRFEMDAWYVDNQSLLLDLRILCRTVFTVIRRDGISGINSATMTEFKGAREREDDILPPSGA